MRDRLFLLHPDFADPAYPKRRFYCWHCALLEGVLASFPRPLEPIDVHRVAWPRPRPELVDLLGQDYQSLPVLVVSSDAPDGPDYGAVNGVRFIADKDEILRYLSVRYGIPEPHP